ncbi:unnamed protein product [Pieris brassicae]|uniref:Uncharacterized protein n=1 Tax=Pieris brassicae TaxID=7116 RepID=A0A9P0TNM7_PIEBR|nr:unnamed protein product [Pieris brassicae]
MNRAPTPAPRPLRSKKETHQQPLQLYRRETQSSLTLYGFRVKLSRYADRVIFTHLHHYIWPGCLFGRNGNLKENPPYAPRTFDLDRTFVESIDAFT